MPTITIDQARTRGRVTLQKAFRSASGFLKDSAALVNPSYDIFLSHAFLDADTIVGVKGLLEDAGLTVYVDWEDDPQLNRNDVTPETAAILRERMNRCSALFYAVSENSSKSKWMPWELGFFDGKKGRCAILPVTKTEIQTFEGQEYLGLYPYVTKDESIGGPELLFVWKSPLLFATFEDWVAGKKFKEFYV